MKAKKTKKKRSSATEESIIKGWTRISEYRFGGLSEEERAQFEKARFAEEQARRTKFVLGEPMQDPTG